MAHKKAAGSAKNLRDSNPKYRGLKCSGGQAVRAGNIIVRQKGQRYHAGPNVYMTNDFSLHAAIDGVVRFYEKKVKRFDNNVFRKTFVAVDTSLDSE